METLTPAERRVHRANAHALHPVVSIGNHGLTAAVLHEIDVALLAHELIKIRVFSDDRAERNALLERICTELSAAPVQHLGKVLIIWRKAAEIEEPEKPARSPRASRTRPFESTVDTKAKPGARRPAAGGQVAAKAAAPRPGAGKPRSNDASARRRRPSDVIATGTAPAKRRAVHSGNAPAARKRAPATTKGPFEPGKRSPRSGSAADSSAGGERRRRVPEAIERGEETGAARRRPALPTTKTSSSAKPGARRRRG